MPAWPEELPQYFVARGYSETLPDQKIESQTDVGPGKARKRFTQNWRAITGVILCTPEQAAALETFYRDTLNGGVLTFFWKAPITQRGALMRFRTPPMLVLESAECISAQLSLWQTAILGLFRFDSTLVSFDSTEVTFDEAPTF